MKDERVTVRFSYKVNMGNYETLDIDYGVAATVEPGETRQDVFNEIYTWTQNMVGEEMEKARKSSRVNRGRS